MKINIYAFPITDKNNPFLDLLYGEINGKSLGIWKFEVKSRSLGQLMIEPISSENKNIIHIHWSPVLYGSRYFLKSFYLLIINFIRLVYLKRRSFKICWTMHNYYSHDYPSPFIDRVGRKLLFFLSDLIIVQQKRFQIKLKDKHQAKNIIFIPLGNYMNVYGQSLESVHNIRGKYGYGDNGIILISFGLIRPYKKNDEIIKVFMKNKNTLDERIKLLIIGPATDKYASELKELIKNNSQITFRNEFVKSEDYADLLSMADYSIFWFDESVLTSSGVILSLSYGLPVITRDIPASEMIRDSVNGYLFENSKGLTEILKKLPFSKKLNKQDVVDSVVNQTWKFVAEKLMKSFAEI